MQWRDREMTKSSLWPSSDHISGSRFSTSHPWCCRFQHSESVSLWKKALALFVGYRGAPSCGTPTSDHINIDTSQPQTVVFLHLLLLLNGRHRTQGLESRTPVTGDLQIWLHYTSHSTHGRCWEKDGCYTHAFLQKLLFSHFFSMAPQDPLASLQRDSVSSMVKEQCCPSFCSMH